MKDENMDEEIYLSDIVNYVKHIFSILYKQKFLILGIFILAILLGGAMSVQQPKQYNTSVIIKLSNVTDPTYSNGQLVTAILQSDEYVLRVLEKEGLVKDLSEVEKIKKGLNIVLITKDGKYIQLSYISSNRQNSTRILQLLTSELISDSEIYFNRTKSQLSRKLTQNENDLSIINSNINATYESLKNLDKIQGMNQETIELSHSRTLDNLQMLTEQRTTLINNILDIRNELENMENSKIVVVTSDGQKEESSSNRTIIVAGIIGLLIGVFAAMMREIYKKE